MHGQREMTALASAQKGPQCCGLLVPFLLGIAIVYRKGSLCFYFRSPKSYLCLAAGSLRMSGGSRIMTLLDQKIKKKAIREGKIIS